MIIKSSSIWTWLRYETSAFASELKLHVHIFSADLWELVEIDIQILILTEKQEKPLFWLQLEVS